jgi:glycosyltransferase involved in cell wall biosynthesis
VKLSVLVPVYNEERTLEEVVGRVCAFPKAKEIILVDDGSTEAGQISWETTDPRITLLRHALRRGPAAARNTGIAHSQGQFIAFLDSDDAFLPAKLETQLSFMQASPTSVLSYTGAIMMDAAGGEFGLFPLGRSRNEYPYIWENCSILTPCVMIRKSLLGDLRFEESLSVGEDLILWARIARLSRPLRIETPLSRVRFLRSSTSVQPEKMVVGVKNLIDDGVLKERHLRFAARHRILSNLNLLIASGYLQIGNAQAVVRHIGIAFWHYPLNPLFLRLAVKHSFLARVVKLSHPSAIPVPGEEQLAQEQTTSLQRRP